VDGRCTNGPDLAFVRSFVHSRFFPRVQVRSAKYGRVTAWKVKYGTANTLLCLITHLGYSPLYSTFIHSFLPRAWSTIGTR